MNGRVREDEMRRIGRRRRREKREERSRKRGDRSRRRRTETSSRNIVKYRQTKCFCSHFENTQILRHLLLENKTKIIHKLKDRKERNKKENEQTGENRKGESTNFDCFGFIILNINQFINGHNRSNFLIRVRRLNEIKDAFDQLIVHKPWKCLIWQFPSLSFNLHRKKKKTRKETVWKAERERGGEGSKSRKALT